jgi:hypothetical protein
LALLGLVLGEESELFDDDSLELPELEPELVPESEEEEEELSEDLESLLDAAVSFLVLSLCSFISRERFLVP